jgi:hypothetical protein
VSLPTFCKSENVPFFWANAERKKYFLNERPLLLERKCRFCTRKDSAKALSDLIDSIFSKISVRLVNDIKSFGFGHTQKCPFWSMPLHFRNASAASAETNTVFSSPPRQSDVRVDKNVACLILSSLLTSQGRVTFPRSSLVCKGAL